MRSIAVGLLVVLAGCAGMHAGAEPEPHRYVSVPEQHDQEWNRKHGRKASDEDGLEQLTVRARFDLQCETATVLILDRTSGGDGPATLAGGQGCGRQVQYSRRLRRSGWTGNLVARNSHWDKVDGSTQTVVVSLERQ